MGAVFPKVKAYVFLGAICLLINISACCIALADNQDYNIYLESDDISVDGSIPEDEVNVTLGNFAISAGTSFVPFVSVVSIAFLGLDTLSFTLVTIILVIIGACQIFLLTLIILNMLPKVLGSGFDV